MNGRKWRLIGGYWSVGYRFDNTYSIDGCPEESTSGLSNS